MPACVRLVGVLLAGLALTACATLRVESDFDPEVDFVAYETFTWLDPPLVETPREAGAPEVDPFTHNTLVDQRVRSGVEAALEQRGYRKAEDSDFALRYDLVNREVTRTSPGFVSPGAFGRRGFYAGSTVYPPLVRTYDEGTLIVDVIDAQTRRIIWRGWAATRTRDGHLDAARLQRVIDGILAEFPPAREGEPVAEEG
ncbi:MAG: DUF4136 domain-containing protein [Myxococcota bacterium]